MCISEEQRMGRCRGRKNTRQLKMQSFLLTLIENSYRFELLTFRG